MFRHPSVSLCSVSLISVFAASFMLLCSGQPAVGQVNPGSPAFSAYDEHSTDTINLQNLNVSLNIPAMSKAGALPFTFALSGAPSYVYTVYEGGGVTDIFPGSSAQPLGGFVNGMLGYYAPVMAQATETSGVSCPSADGSGIANKFANWSLLLADGTIHVLPTSDVLYSGATCSSSFSDVTLDGSGFTLSVKADTANSSYTVTSIYSKGGMNLSTNEIQDPNGNSLKFNGITWTDSLGLTALNQGSYGNTTWNWTDVNGGSPSVSLTEANFTIKTAFGCAGLTDSTNTSGTLPTSANFPDGSTIGLAWEVTPGYPSDRTGRLSALTLRSGGTVQYNWNPGSGPNDGLNCIYKIPNEMTRKTSDGTNVVHLGRGQQRQWVG